MTAINSSEACRGKYYREAVASYNGSQMRRGDRALIYVAKCSHVVYTENCALTSRKCTRARDIQARDSPAISVN